MGSLSNPLRVAVLMNSSSLFAPAVADSFVSILSRTAPQAEIKFYDPIVKQEYPDPFKYDLVILSGGTTDPMSSEPWVLKMMDFIRQTAAAQESNREATAKLLGICWGHQAICVAFGGTVETMNRKPALGPQRIDLTEEGKKLIGFAAAEGCYTAMEFHRRAITKPAAGFIALAEDNEVFLSSSNMILSTQAHPEMKGPLAMSMLKSAPAYAADREKSELESTEKLMMSHEDGDALFNCIIEWIAER